MLPIVITAIFAALLAGAAAWWFRTRVQAAKRDLSAARDELTALRNSHEQTLSRERAQQQALFDSMIEGVLVLDGNGRIRLANQAVERFFGVGSDLRGKTMMEAFRLHELQEICNRTLVEGQVSGCELDLPSLDRRTLRVNAAVLLAPDGRQQGMILVFHDLTRLKQLENTRSEFVANVSHELRTPLSLIKGYCETLLDGAKDDATVATRFLQTIEKHADRLTFLIEDLLTISQLESGQIALSQQTVELAAQAQRTFDELQARAAAKKITLLNEVPASLQVRADAERLQQVFSNLVDNAIKYGRPDGRVVIGTRAADDGRVEVWVSDNGPGIPPEHVGRIFERFYRVDKARSRDAGGTGLGLSIVKHIVQSHGGDLWVKSELEKGTTFHFTLPKG